MPFRPCFAPCLSFFLPLLFLLCLPFSCHGARAAEVINDYAVTVTVRPDGGMRVREEITATAEGKNIKRGIYRDFPLRYSGPAPYRGQVLFTVVSASLDNEPLAIHDTELHGNTIRILMRAPEPLEPGLHRFVLEYDTSLHLRFYETHGELNWNVTGTWGFEIRRFSCRIVLPQGVSIQKTAAWTGQAGSKNPEGVSLSRPAANVAVFTSLRGSGMFDARMAPGEEFTVAVAFPKEAIADPVAPLVERQRVADAEDEARAAREETRRAEEERAAEARGPLYSLLYHHPTLPVQISDFCCVALYFFLAWRRVGKDPEKGTIIPRFHPPAARYMGKGRKPKETLTGHMSPMAVEYLRSSGKNTGRGLAALFISLAARGLCSIRKADGKTYALHPAPRPQMPGPELQPEAKAAYEALVKEADAGELGLRTRQNSVRHIFSAAREAVRHNYATSWAFNTWVNVLGWLVVLPLGFALSLQDVNFARVFDTPLDLLPDFLLTFFMFDLFTLLFILPLLLWGRDRTSRLACIIVFIFPILLFFALYFEELLSNFELMAPAAMLFTALIFTALMKAPSKEARAALDEIEGLSIYMRAAEKDRLEMFHKNDDWPRDTPELFQRLLPYALVLGLEKTWCIRFAGQIAEGLLEKSGIDRQIIADSDGLAGFTVGFSSAVAASAAQQPSSSSSSSSSSSGSGFSSGGGGAGSGSGGGGGGGI